MLLFAGFLKLGKLGVLNLLGCAAQEGAKIGTMAVGLMTSGVAAGFHARDHPIETLDKLDIESD
jgi:hypothetical protein